MIPSRPGTLELDFQERSGFQIGRAVALADWHFRKDDATFRALCERLYQRKWQKRRRAEQPERVRGILARYRERHREAISARWKARHPRPIITCTCTHCGRPFHPRRYRRAKWCSKACSNAFWGKHRKTRNRGLRNMTIMPVVLATIRAEPGLTLRELLDHVPGVKYGSLATKLSGWVKEGVLVRVGCPENPRVSRYSLSAAGPSPSSART